MLDYNSKKELVGIQLINASKLIMGMTDKNFSEIKSILTGPRECRVDIRQKNNILILKIYLTGKSAEISPVISIPSIRETSPSLRAVPI